MLRKTMLRMSLLAAVLVPAAASAAPYDDLMTAQAAFRKATSWRADEQFSNGRSVTVEYSAPDRWRIQPAPNIVELIIGNDVYMVRNGQAFKMPIGGAMLQQTIQGARFSVDEEIKQTARDLGLQSVGGQSLHAYSYTAHGVPVTLYLGPDSLPVQSRVQNPNGATIIKYSKYNQPISIEAQ